ncbi:MAG: HU family DNA-binding protein [Prevotella sp.]|nr:HU family DNA-binding protein [Prevotella sp.]
MVRYKLYQDNRKNSTTRGQWYGRAAVMGVTNLQTLADRIQRNCTAKKSDVVAVLTELVEAMADELKEGRRVKLDGFGSFKIGLSTKGAETPKAFTPTKNVKGLHVLFQPEVKKSADGTRVKTFLSGVQVAEYDEYDKPDEEEPEP